MSFITQTTILPPPDNKKYYVNNNRTDSYTEDGSELRPFKTIQAAINQVITNGDNASYIYTIDVQASEYPENLVFNNSNLYYLSFESTQGCSINPASGNAIDCSSNNGQLGLLTFSNIAILKPINIVNTTTGQSMMSSGLRFTSCVISGTITLNNLSVAEFLDCQVTGNTTITNVISCGFQGGDGFTASSISLVTNSGLPKPSGFSTTFGLVDHTIMTSSTISMDSGSIWIFRNGARIGTPGGTLTIAGSSQFYNAVIRSNLSLTGGTLTANDVTFAGNATISSGATLILNGSFIVGTITNSGTLTTNNKSSQISNDSSVSGSTINNALANLNALFQEVLLVAINNGGSTTANTTIASWTTVNKDTNSAFNSSTGVYTVPVAGDYQVNFSAATTSGTPLAKIYKNGNLMITGIGSGVRTNVNIILNDLVIGDTITVALDSTLTLTSTNTDTILRINNISNISAAQVLVRYHGATATITGSLSNVSYTSSDWDTNSAYSGSTFTAPSAGKYVINVSLAVTATTVTAGNAQVLQLNKNGSQYANYEFVAGAATQKPMILALTTTVSLAQNDTITIQVSSAASGPSVSASNFYNYLEIMKISG